MYDKLPARPYCDARHPPGTDPPRSQRHTSEELPAVLVVDDHATIRQILSLVLEDAGYRVREAPDGLPALQQLRASREPMVVLLDMEMPGMDGVQVMQVVAADAALTTHYAYVLVTANAAALPIDFATLLSELSVPVIPKPFDIDELLEAVAQAITRLGEHLA